MSVGEFCRFASAWRSHEISFLYQERFVHFFNSSSFFTDGSRDGVETYRTALEFVDDCRQDTIVHIVEAVLVDVKSLETDASDVKSYRSVALYSMYAITGINSIAM